MNYHLMIDDKFIDQFIESAEIVAPNNNIYIFTFARPTRFVKSQKGLFVLPFSDEFNNIIKGINGNDRLYIHWFEKYLINVLKMLHSDVPIYLFFWGGDFLEQTKEFSKFNYDILTRKYMFKKELKILLYFPRNPIGYIKNIKKYFWLQRSKKINDEYEKTVREIFLNRLDYFCHWNKLDMYRVVGAYGGNPRLLNFCYNVSLDKINKPESIVNVPHESINIWLGNSDTITNNHFDALESLKLFRNKKVRLYCPLNYENGEYQQQVTKRGMKYFAENWNSIIDFMPIKQYLNLMDTINIVVMYHNRTQAAGNIFAFIKMGKKVYLKKQSTIFSLLIENGIKVFDSNLIKELTFEEFSTPLSSKEIEKNYSVISKLFSDKQQLLDLEKIIN